MMITMTFIALSCLKQLGGNTSGGIHTSRLKLRMLSVLPNLKGTMQGKNFVLSFEDDVGSTIQKTCKHDDYSHANTMHLVRAARIIRKEIFQLEHSFNGSFTEKCQQNVSPRSLWLT